MMEAFCYWKCLKFVGWKETDLPNIYMDICFFAPDGTMQTGVCTENTDVREVGFHPPKFVYRFNGMKIWKFA